MKRIILILAIIFSVKSYSQDPAFTQSFMVPESINPSFSGFYETTKAGLLYKNQQWSGFDFNLNSQYLYFDDWYPDLNSGVGISLMNHQETFTNYSLKQLNLSWAYKFKINYDGHFKQILIFGFETKDFEFDNLLLKIRLIFFKILLTQTHLIPSFLEKTQDMLTLGHHFYLTMIITGLELL